MSNRITKTIQVYDKIAHEYAKNIEKRFQAEDFNEFTELLTLNSKVLDIGCAAGRDAKAFSDKGFGTIGIDLSEKLLAIAKKKHPGITFLKANMLKLPFSDNTFDGIWARAVLHHLDRIDMACALKEWNRVLKQKGVIFLSTKKGKGNWQGTDELSAGTVREYTLLSEEELNQMLVQEGFFKIKLTINKDSTRNISWLKAIYKKV